MNVLHIEFIGFGSINRLYRTIRLLLLTGMMVAISACSSESLQRTGYETLQNIRDTQCQKDLTSECSQRESYDTYQRKLKENETAE